MFDLKLEMRSTLRKFFSRTGLVCHISNSQHSDLVSITQGLHTSPLFFHCNTYILTCSALKVLSFKKRIQNFLIAFTTSENCIYVLKIYPSIHQFLEPSKNLMILLFHKYMYDFLNMHIMYMYIIARVNFKFVQKKLGKKNNKLDTLQASLKEHSIKISVD